MNILVVIFILSISICGCIGKNVNDDKTSGSYDMEAIQDIVKQEGDTVTSLPLQSETESLTEKQDDGEDTIGEKENVVSTEELAIEISIVRNDKSILNDLGQVMAIVYYDKPVVIGDVKIAQKINVFFDNEEECWFGGNGRLTGFSDDYYGRFIESFNTMKENYGEEDLIKYPLRYTVDTEIKLLDENTLSILQITTNWIQQRHWNYYGSTFDLETGELVPITDLVELDAEGIKKIIVDATYDSSGYYDELGEENYIISYYDMTFDMRYEYFYDGEYFYIIDNLGGYYRDGVLIRWNGKWGEEYEVTALQYIVDGESGKLVEKILNADET